MRAKISNFCTFGKHFFDMYKRFIRPFLFKLDPERAHNLTFSLLKVFGKCPFMFRAFLRPIFDKKLEREVFGLKFRNPIGLAAGLDKDAKLYKELWALGFGFIEIGTVTPKAQPGNEKKRLFRLIEDSGIVNRMGFNNEGVRATVKRLKKNTNVLIGGNIGKNKLTLNENAVDDYKICFEALFPYVDYFVVNVSSPNTPNLRALQDKEPLKYLLTTLQKLNEAMPKAKPILLKIAPDLSDEQLLDIIEIVKDTQIAGVIATNTTLSREGLQSPNRVEAGGLSGKPLAARSTEVIRFLHQRSGGAFPIIGVGGIHSAQDAIEKFEAGASLIQLYTGFIYEGAGLIKEINKALLREQV